MIVRTVPEWEYVVEKLLKSRDRNGVRVIGEDFETRDRGYPDTSLVGFSVGWYEEDDSIDGAYIPIGHVTGEMQLQPEDVEDGLRLVNEDPEIQVVAHNAAYDILVSRLFPNPIFWDENIFDTMTVAWLLNTNGVGSFPQIETGNGRKGLKQVVPFYFGYDMQELTELAPMEKYKKDGVEFDDMRVDKIPVAKLGPYAYDDAVEILKLREMFLWGYDNYDRPKRKLKDSFRKLLPDVMKGMNNIPETKRVWDVMEREFTFSLVDMTMMGNELSKDILYDFRDDVSGEMTQVRKNMFAARVGQDFEAIADPELVRKASIEYQRIDELFDLPRDHPNYPRNPDTGKPRGKGWMRTQMLKAHGLRGHPVEAKIRDNSDSVRQDVKDFPELAHKVFNTNSIPQLNEVLFDENGLPPVGEKGKSGLFSTDKDCISVWVGQGHEIAVQLDRFREIDKLYGTYLVGMPAKVPSDGRVRTRFGRVRTGRLSSSDPNLQNIPTSDEFPIRTAFVPTGGSISDYEVLEWNTDDEGNQLKPKKVKVETPPSGIVDEHGREFKGGWVVDDGRLVEWWGPKPPSVHMVGDYSQLEIRLLAHISKDPVLLKAVREGQDIHALTAQAVFDEVPNNISLEEVKEFYGKYRKDAKPVNFGVIYGMGPQALAAALGCTLEEAQDIIDNRYMNKYKGVKAWIQWVHKFAVANGHVATATGRRRHLPAATKPVSGKKWWDLTDKEKDDKRAVGGAKRQAQNTPVQGLAADVLGLAMRDVRRHYKSLHVDTYMLQGDRRGALPTLDRSNPLWLNHLWLTLQIHDELVGESHPALANYFMDTSVGIMENAGGMKLRVPLAVDAALGGNWFHAKD